VRLVSVLALALAVTPAAADRASFGPLPKPGPPVRKPASVTWMAEELAVFADAMMADKAGDLEKAESFYRRSDLDEKRPEAIYNLADVQRRMERTKDAIESYKKYLELAPDAPDRADVGRLIDKLAATPPIVTIDGEDPRAVVFIDGVLAGPSPQSVSITEGDHSIDRIGPTSYNHHFHTGKPVEARHLSGYGSKEEAGNVVLSAAPSVRQSGRWRDDSEREWTLPGRMTLEPGRYQTTLFRDGYACNPLVFDVPRGDGVTFVYIDAPPRERNARGACLPITVKVKKVVFPP
jgi:tetratricopeptide (TPR) repeat protein